MGQDHGCTALDFAGYSLVAQPGDPLWGINQFKRGFAGLDELRKSVAVHELVRSPLLVAFGAGDEGRRGRGGAVAARPPRRDAPRPRRSASRSAGRPPCRRRPGGSAPSRTPSTGPRRGPWSFHAMNLTVMVSVGSPCASLAGLEHRVREASARRRTRSRGVEHVGHADVARGVRPRTFCLAEGARVPVGAVVGGRQRLVGVRHPVPSRSTQSRNGRESVVSLSVGGPPATAWVMKVIVEATRPSALLHLLDVAAVVVVVTLEDDVDTVGGEEGEQPVRAHRSTYLLVVVSVVWLLVGVVGVCRSRTAGSA